MKLFCKNCGQRHDYVGLANKPSSCKRCSEDFIKKSTATINDHEPSTSKDNFAFAHLKYNCFLEVISIEDDDQV